LIEINVRVADAAIVFRDAVHDPPRVPDFPMATLSKPARRFAAILALVLMLVAIVLAWRGWTGAERAKARYQTAPAEMAAIAQTISANGTLNPVTLVSVGTQVSGTVEALHADFNDRVSEGEVLLELDPSILHSIATQSQGQLASARATLELSRANEKRARPVFDRGFISQQDYQQTLETLHAAEAQVSIAEGLVEQSQTNLRYAVIRSPVAGVVVERTVDVGQTVAASFQTPTLFRIAKDLKDMQIDSSFAEADVGQIRAGQAAAFTVDAFPGRTFEGTVRQVRLNPTTQQNVVTYDVVIGVRNEDEVLLPGMTAYVNVAVAHRDHVLAVPTAALRFRPRGSVATTVSSEPEGVALYVLLNGEPERRVVVVGIGDGHRVEIVSGRLAPGERVVTSELSGPSDQAASAIRLRPF
jgi:HlyD family secretion protein